MKLRIVSKSGVIPRYETEGSAGMDLKAYINDPIILKPMERKLIPTGIFIELPLGYEGQVRARSGLAIKKGIGLVNSIGTIDSDYRGELKIPAINFSNEDFEINNGDRIAQLIVAKYERAEIEVVEELNDTVRGAGGFGHTGV
ncbi:MAG: dUTP diphosphatase [Peptostreptococcaceae bacterium]|nr:dUTP diphosphatase [Peptostreptococcaceae bacterium]